MKIYKQVIYKLIVNGEIKPQIKQNYSELQIKQETKRLIKHFKSSSNTLQHKTKRLTDLDNLEQQIILIEIK